MGEFRKRRLFKVARDLNVSKKELLAFLQKQGYEQAISGEGLSASLTEEEAYLALRERYADDKKAASRIRELRTRYTQEDTSEAALSPQNDSLIPFMIANLKELLTGMANSNSKDELRNMLNDMDIENPDQLAEAIDAYSAKVEVEALRERLDLLHDYEKKFLTLIKEHKEEIKFINDFQEDVRRERAHFFSQVLRDVSSTLDEAQVDDDIAAEWIEQLVASYTASLDVSNSLTTSRAIDMSGKIKQDADEHVSALQKETPSNANGNA